MLKNSAGSVKFKQIQDFFSFLPPFSWYVAGSYAVPHVKAYNDIDVYFTDVKYYKEVLSLLRRNNTPTSTTTYATTFEFYRSSMQLISCKAGNPEEVLSTFDLNICKYAILSDGKSYKSPQSTTDLSVSAVTSETFARVEKYATRLGFSDTKKEAHYKRLIDTYLEDTTLTLKAYSTEQYIPVNRVLTEWVNSKNVQRFPVKYFKKQAAKRAPELLI